MRKKNGYQIINRHCALLLGDKYFIGPTTDGYFNEIADDLQLMINDNESEEDINEAAKKYAHYFLRDAGLI